MRFVLQKIVIFNSKDFVNLSEMHEPQKLLSAVGQVFFLLTGQVLRDVNRFLLARIDETWTIGQEDSGGNDL